MDFEVTATRKRPKSLGEMVGQDFVVATLSHALRSGKVAPAYLFSGPRGTGKTSTARILARSMNCDQGPTDEPCGVCPSCVEISRGTAPDVIEIDGASNTSVNDVREIKDEVLYPPQSSRKKIYIIDEVHMLSNSAFNALLKTIEEPPPYIIFVFATTEVHKVPATIRSRCQQFRFRLFPPELIRDKLVEAAVETGRAFEEDALYWIAREADGSMRDAYTLFDQVLSFSEERITLSGIRDKMGLVGLEGTSDLMTAASSGDRRRALSLLDGLLGAGTAVEQVLVELTEFLRNLLLLSYGIDKPSILGLSPDRFSEGPRNAWDSRRLEFALEDACTLFRDIRYSLNPRFELELFVGRLCGLVDRLEPGELVDRIETLRSELTGANTGEKKKTPEKPMTGGPDATGETAAERFFSEFIPARNRIGTELPTPAGVGPASTPNGTTEELNREDLPASAPPQDCEVPVDIGLEPSGDRLTRLIETVRKNNLTLAAALDKVREHEWRGRTLVLTFDSGYEAALVNNEAESLRRAGEIAGIPTLSVETRTLPVQPAEDEGLSSAELVRRVFRGQIIGG